MVTRWVLETATFNSRQERLPRRTDLHRVTHTRTHLLLLLLIPIHTHTNSLSLSLSLSSAPAPAHPSEPGLPSGWKKVPSQSRPGQTIAQSAISVVVFNVSVVRQHQRYHHYLKIKKYALHPHPPASICLSNKTARTRTRARVCAHALTNMHSTTHLLSLAHTNTQTRTHLHVSTHALLKQENIRI